METILESFADLLRAAREQPTRQHFLLVFVKAILPDGAKADQVARFHSKQGGALVPVMYVDKDEYELSDFANLLMEAQHTAEALGNGVDTDWDLVVVGCLDGRTADEPEPQEIDDAFHGLLRAIRLGQSLCNLIAFDHEGNPVHFES